jgi:heat shock protein HtpX
MNNINITLLLAILTLLMVFMGSALGSTTGLVFAFLLVCAMSFFSYWFSDKIVLKICGIRTCGLPQAMSIPCVRCSA